MTNIGNILEGYSVTWTNKWVHCEPQQRSVTKSWKN